ncbi:Unknown protein sequence [Pseudomonas coronafaciens pv. oryzae]|nr:Unknown protein sequence [Pseudomonas coronafaciens pv. oryzae]
MPVRAHRYPTIHVPNFQVTWLYGFDFEIKVIVRLPGSAAQ